MTGNNKFNLLNRYENNIPDFSKGNRDSLSEEKKNSESFSLVVA